MSEAINRFVGNYRFLSNFWLCTVEFDGVTYPSVEHAYQAAKTDVPSERAWILAAPSPGVAKRRGQKVTLQPLWGDLVVRTCTMFALLEQKFRDPVLATKLVATGDVLLVEGNTWGDTFWGMDLRTGKGQNLLGKALMQLRNELRQGQ